MAQTYHQRPAAIFGLSVKRDQWLAYQFDEAVLIFGQRIEQLLQETNIKGQPKYTLDVLLTRGLEPVQGTLEMLMALTGEMIHSA